MTDATNPATHNPWTTLSTREIYRNSWIRVREDQVVQPSGKPGIYGVVEMGPAVGVVALDDEDRVYLVGQYRYATECYSWEIITGYCDGAEEPLVSARRELREEAGLEAEHWTPLGRCQISNSITNQVGYLFLAQGLSTGESAPDDTEVLAVRRVPITEALGMADSGEIDQAYSLAGLYRAWRLLHPAR